MGNQNPLEGKNAMNVTSGVNSMSTGLLKALAGKY